MSGDNKTFVPGVTWAQRSNLIIITVEVSDCENPEIKVEKDSLHFKGIGGTEKKPYEISMNLLKEINPETSKFAVRPRCIEFALDKAEEGPYWDRLLSDKRKQHWLRVDFTKWKNEDSEDEEGPEFDMSGFSGMGSTGTSFDMSGFEDDLSGSDGDDEDEGDDEFAAAAPGLGGGDGAIPQANADPA